MYLLPDTMIQTHIRRQFNRLRAALPWAKPHEAGVLLSVAVPQGNEHKPEAAELFFASLHAFHNQHLSCEIVADQAAIAFRVWVPQSLRSYVEAQLYAQYPDCQIEPTSDSLQTLSSQPVRTAYLTLTQRHLLPSRRRTIWRLIPWLR